jgi:hypothetical protein
MCERIVWTERALHDAERLDRPARDRVLAAVERFAATGDGDLKSIFRAGEANGGCVSGGGASG